MVSRHTLAVTGPRTDTGRREKQTAAPGPLTRPSGAVSGLLVSRSASRGPHTDAHEPRGVRPDSRRPPVPPQVSITDYVVFDQCGLFRTIMHATHSVATAAQAPVEKVADKLRTAFWSQQLQCQPSLLGANSSGVWVSSGKNELHVAKGSLVGG